MFMFWSKRTVLTKRLLKAKVLGEHETEREAQEESSRVHVAGTCAPAAGETALLEEKEEVVAAAAAAAAAVAAACRSSVTSTRSSVRRARRIQQGCCGCGDGAQDEEEEPARLTRCKNLLKTLKENQLEMLLTAVESYGADLGSCILVARQGASKEELEEAAARLAEEEEDEADDDKTKCQQQDEGERQLQQCNNHLRHYRHNCHRHYRYLHRLHHRYHNYRHQHRYHCCAAFDEQKEQQRQPRRFNFEASRLQVRADLAPTEPHLLCCQIWRWPDLTRSSELKRLPVCHPSKDPVYVCCNPYHWSRLCKPESPPPPYCLIADRLRPEDRAPSEGDPRRCRNTAPMPFPGSLTTDGEGESEQKEWCTLAYWELGGRVGRLYPVEPATINVFDSLHDGDGLCLSTLAENHTASPAVQRTRSKIGLGLMLSQEADGVWAYNRSESPIFVNSPTLDDPESRTLLVYRVPPGFCLNIFDRAKILQLSYASRVASLSTNSASNDGLINNNNNNNNSSNNSSGASTSTAGFASGPVDVNSVRISFAKGWGPKYSRQEVTSCPCWLEILLAPCR